MRSVCSERAATVRWKRLASNRRQFRPWEAAVVARWPRQKEVHEGVKLTEPLARCHFNSWKALESGPSNKIHAYLLQSLRPVGILTTEFPSSPYICSYIFFNRQNTVLSKANNLFYMKTLVQLKSLIRISKELNVHHHNYGQFKKGTKSQPIRDFCR